VALRVAHKFDSPSAAFHDGTLGNPIQGVVGSFRVDIGPIEPDKTLGVSLTKRNYEIYGLESGDKLQPFVILVDGTTVRFDHSHRFVCVHSDDQHVAQLFGAVKKPYMSHMQEFEATVRKHHDRTLAPALLEYRH
jgi:hypothetical protein